jgi:tripartite-type tricarboxylate transporter receptor subunit TctC
VALAPTGASAQADFYKGKTIELVISTSGGIDANARMVARHLVNHIPGHPTIVPRNMPGAGHIRAANYVFSQAPQDGTVIGTFIPAFVLAQVLDRSKGITFNAANFNWLASTSSKNSTVYTWHTSGIRTLEDAMKRPVLMGATGVGSYTVIYPTIMNSLLGTKFKLVMGYKSGTEVGLAMQRGEVEGRAGNNFNSLKVENGQWLKDGKINLIAQIGLDRDPEFPNVPLIADYAKSDQDRQILQLFSADVMIGRPFATSPNVPPERVALLRKAFDDLMQDPAYLAESKATGLDVTPVSGKAVQKLVADIVNTPENVLAKARLAMEPKDTIERTGSAGQQ